MTYEITKYLPESNGWLLIDVTGSNKGMGSSCLPRFKHRPRGALRLNRYLEQAHLGLCGLRRPAVSHKVMH